MAAPPRGGYTLRMILPALLTAALATPCPTLPAAWEAIARPFPGRVGVAAMCLETGQSFSRRGGEAFYTQSVYKLPISMAALDLAAKQRWKLDQPIRVFRQDVVPGTFPSRARDAFKAGKPDVPLQDLVRTAISQSDNTASDVLLRLAGGPKAVNAYVSGLDLTGVKVGTPIGAFVPARNTITPNAAVTLLGTLWRGRGVTPEGRALLLDAMAKCETGPGRLKAGLPKGAALAHKTGTAGTYGGVTLATNDVGIVTLPDGRHLAIAAFVADARATEPASERIIARLARAAWDCWTVRK